MRIAIAGMATESCAFSPLPTRLEDFRILGADEFTETYPFLADYEDIAFLPGVVARALPGGPVERSAYDSIKRVLLRQLEAARPLDGVFLDMHGAMFVAGMEDAEADLLEAIRATVGEIPLISASYDLHGNVSRRVMAALDIITGFRTAPHIDRTETRARAMTLLLRCLRDGLRPFKAFVPIPVALPGEKTSTEWQPGKGIYAAIPSLIDGSAVMDATLQVGYAWADEPRNGACAIAIGLGKSAVSEAAVRLARLYWDSRKDFRFGAPALSIDGCLQRANAANDKPVIISDSGDNPTAGAAGDTTGFLARALALGIDDMIYAGIVDAAAVAACMEAGVGAELALDIGGKLDAIHSTPLKLRGMVAFVHRDAENAKAVLQVGGLHIILTSKRTAFHLRRQFTELGLDPESHKIVAVKIGYLEPELKAMAAQELLALSPGAVNLDFNALDFQRVRRPLFPLDAAMRWTPEVDILR